MEMPRCTRLDSILQLDPSSPLGGKETRGLDTPFSRATYIETDVERELLRLLGHGGPHAVVLCGNPGDGKTALLQSLLAKLGVELPEPRPNALEARSGRDGRLFHVLFDGSAAGFFVDTESGTQVDRSSTEHLDAWFEFAERAEPSTVALLAVNDGRLLEYLDAPEHRDGELGSALWKHMEGKPAAFPPQLQLVDLNRRSLLAAGSPEGGRVAELLRALAGEEADWAACSGCPAAASCPAYASFRLVQQEAALRRAADRLRRALLLLERSGRFHLTIRELRALLAAGFFGAGPCERIQRASPEQGRAGAFWNALFSPLADSPLPQHRELSRLDPAGADLPALDRRCLLHPHRGLAHPDEAALWRGISRDFLEGLAPLLPPSGDTAEDRASWRRLAYLLADTDELLPDPMSLLGAEQAWRWDPALESRGARSGGEAGEDREASRKEELAEMLRAAFKRIAGLPEEAVPGDRLLLGQLNWAGDETRFGWTVAWKGEGLEPSRSASPLLGADQLPDPPAIDLPTARGLRLELRAETLESLGRLAEGSSPLVPEFRAVAEAAVGFGERARTAVGIEELVAVHPTGTRLRFRANQGGERPLLLLLREDLDAGPPDSSPAGGEE